MSFAKDSTHKLSFYRTVVKQLPIICWFVDTKQLQTYQVTNALLSLPRNASRSTIACDSCFPWLTSTTTYSCIKEQPRCTKSIAATAPDTVAKQIKPSIDCNPRYYKLGSSSHFAIRKHIRAGIILGKPRKYHKNVIAIVSNKLRELGLHNRFKLGCSLTVNIQCELPCRFHRSCPRPTPSSTHTFTSCSLNLARPPHSSSLQTLP